MENLPEEAEYLPTDSIYDTNWCDMPNDVKLECIEKMEFKERWSMRCTAKTEKSLVESQKIKFYSCDIEQISTFPDYPNHRVTLSSLIDDEFYDFSKSFKNPHKVALLLNCALKIGVFTTFEIATKNPIVKQGLANYTGEIPAKFISFYGCDNKTVASVLKKLKNGVESIKVRWRRYAYVDEVLAVPQMWIDKNAEIGSTFQVAVLYADDSFEEFSEYLAERIVSKSDKRVRIRTNNADRHILLERGLDDVVGVDGIVGTDYKVQLFRLMVISAEIKESEYDDNCKEWICKMSP